MQLDNILFIESIRELLYLVISILNVIKYENNENIEFLNIFQPNKYKYKNK